MSVPIAALFLSFILGHSADSPSNRHNEKSVGFANDRAKALDCADPNGYTLVVARDMIRDANDVSIVQGNQVLKIMTLPGQSEVSGFTLNWAKKIKGGFEISIEYGTRIYYEKRFIVMCRRNKFYLSKIRVATFDKHYPEKWSIRVIRVKPNLPLEKFSIDSYFEWPILRPGAVTPRA